MKKTGIIHFFMIIIVATAICRAEEPTIPFSTGHPADDRPALPDYLPKKPGKGLSLPPTRVAPDTVAQGQTFELKGVDFEGNTIFSNPELFETARDFIGDQVNLSDLEEIRYRLTRKYIDQGYINSGAILKPGQEVDDGVVIYLIMEGRVDNVNIAGNKRLRRGYIEQRILPDGDLPFNVFTLQENFQMLLQDPLIQQMNGRIRPGISPGEAFLDLDIVRARPYELSLTADNHRTPSTGAEGVTATGTVWNLTGSGDRLDASLGISEGVNDVGTRFTMPVNALGSRFSLGYSQNDNSVIEEPFSSVDIESESRNFEINLTHPLLRTLTRNVEAGVTLAARKSQTTLDGADFSFSKGADNGESKVTALRLIQSYVDRTPSMALTLRSTVSVGLDIFDATIHDGHRPDGEFLAWLVQTQYARRLGDKLGQVILRGDLQLADDNLLSLEQFASGGVNSVRGYRENQRVRDNGYLVSAEWRYPLWTDKKEGRLQTSLFTDFGSAWNKGEDIDEDPLHSIGVGLLWKINRFAMAEIYLAHDLEKAAQKYDHNIQDDGIHFRFTVNFFPKKG